MSEEIRLDGFVMVPDKPTSYYRIFTDDERHILCFFGLKPACLDWIKEHPINTIEENPTS